MDRPRLRPLEAFPLPKNGQRFLGLRDPSRLTDAVATLPPVAVAIVQLFDGETTRAEICAEFQRRYGTPLQPDALDKLIDQLDQAYLLDSERFRQHSATVFGAFAAAPTRKAHLAGDSYPADPVALAAQLDGYFDPPHGPGRPSASSGVLPRAIVAPHIDFTRGGAAYAWAYKPLVEAATLPELVVVFGTDHMGAEQPFTLTRKHYETPFGAMQTDVELVDALTAKVGERLGTERAQALFKDEYHHRGEHSLEFQMVWLRHVWKDRADAIKVVPILCGSLHDFVESGKGPRTDPRVDVVLSSLVELVGARPTLWIAGADLAHVGPRFGDNESLDATDRSSLERRDHETLVHASAGDAAAWFDEIRKEKDRRRVCGLPPIFALLESARPGAGRLAAYAQCPADEDGGSIVSIASLIYG
ncbi:MAG TPA: AmmeMemoRadiSam system protein B [Polyangia bacterium]